MSRCRRRSRRISRSCVTPLARRAVCTILGADPGISVSGEAGDGAEACRLADQLLPDVVMLTTFSDGHLIQRALSGGASGFLLKTSAPEDLPRAVRSAQQGGLVMSPTVARWVVQHWVSGRAGDLAVRDRLEVLSPRQREVLAALAEGDSNAEIGRRLHLSEGTVKGYVSEIIAALGVRNRVEAAVLAHQAG